MRHTEQTIPTFQGEYYRRGKGGGIEDNCKGQPTCHHCRCWWRTKYHKVSRSEKYILKLKAWLNLQPCGCGFSWLTPVSFMVNGQHCWSRAKQRQTDNCVQIFLTAAAGSGDTEVDRKSLPDFLQSSDCIHRQSHFGSSGCLLTKSSDWTPRARTNPHLLQQLHNILPLIKDITPSLLSLFCPSPPQFTDLFSFCLYHPSPFLQSVWICLWADP